MTKFSDKTSMRWCFYFVILFFGLPSWAFQYQIEANSLVRPSLLRAHQLAQMFAAEGLWSVSGPSLVRAGMPFDFLFVNQDWSKALLVKEGLVAPAEKNAEIFTDEKTGAMIFHFKFAGSNYLLMALGFSSQELKEVLKPLRPRTGFSRWSLLMNSAQAEPCGLSASALANVGQCGRDLEEGVLLRTIGKCATDALQGVRSSGEQTLEFFKKLKDSPAALFQEMKNSFVELKDFVLNFRTEISTALAMLGDLSPEQKWQVACTMTGELVGQAAQAAVGTAALVKILPKVISGLRQSFALLGKLAELRKSGFRGLDLDFATKEILSCAR